MRTQRLIDRVGPNPVLHSWGYVDAYLRMPERQAPLPKQKFYRRNIDGLPLWLPLYCAVTLLQHTFANNDGTNQATAFTPTVDTTGASLIVIGIGTFSFDGSSGGITDSASNTYTALTEYRGGSVIGQLMCYKYAPATSATHKWKWGSGNTTFPTIWVQVYSGTQTSSDPFVAGTDQGRASSGTNPDIGVSVTPSGVGDVFVTGEITQTSDVTAIGSGFTLLDHAPNTGAVGYGSANLISSDGSSKNPTWTSASDNFAVGIAIFKAASGITVAQEIAALLQAASGQMIGRMDN